MASNTYDINPLTWVKVATGSCMVDTAHHCRAAKVTTQQTGTPDPGTKAFHTLSTTDARIFSNGCADGVFVMLHMPIDQFDDLVSEGRAPYVVVTGDNLA